MKKILDGLPQEVQDALWWGLLVHTAVSATAFLLGLLTGAAIGALVLFKAAGG